MGGVNGGDNFLQATGAVVREAVGAAAAEDEGRQDHGRHPGGGNGTGDFFHGRQINFRRRDGAEAQRVADDSAGEPFDSIGEAGLAVLTFRLTEEMLC